MSAAFSCAAFFASLFLFPSLLGSILAAAVPLPLGKSRRSLLSSFGGWFRPGSRLCSLGLMFSLKVTTGRSLPSDQELWVFPADSTDFRPEFPPSFSVCSPLDDSCSTGASFSCGSSMASSGMSVRKRSRPSSFTWHRISLPRRDTCSVLTRLGLRGAKRRVSPRLAVGDPLPQGDEALVASVDRQAVPVHQDALVTFGEVQAAQSRTQRQEALQLKLLRQRQRCGRNKRTSEHLPLQHSEPWTEDEALHPGRT